MKKEIRVVVIIFISIGFIVHDLGIKKEPHIDPPSYSDQIYKVSSTSIPGSGELTSDSTPDFILYINNR